MERFLLRLWCGSIAVGGVTGCCLETQRSWNNKYNDSVDRAVAPILGSCVGIVGGAFPPIGVYWLYLYYEPEVGFYNKQ